MRFFILFCISFVLFANITFAQQQLEHKKRTYIDKNERFYVNKALPIYLRLATSPDDWAPSHLLKSETCKEYANPLYFDQEGYNTFRTPSKVDKITRKTIIPKEDIIFEVYADGKAPKTKSKFLIKKERKYQNSGIIYYGKDLKINLNSKDIVSGVEDIHYSMNKKEFTKYSNDFPIDKEQTHVLKYYSSDNVGNAEETNFKEFVVDLTPPITEIELDGPMINDILSPKLK